MDSDWLSMFLSFISWVKSLWKCFQQYVALCHYCYSCGVDFPIFILEHYLDFLVIIIIMVLV